jgi:hypothetical protein
MSWSQHPRGCFIPMISTRCTRVSVRIAAQLLCSDAWCNAEELSPTMGAGSASLRSTAQHCVLYCTVTNVLSTALSTVLYSTVLYYTVHYEV